MLVILSAIIVLRKNATVKVLDFIVPVMAVCYFFITLFIIAVNLRQIPSVFARIFEEAFGLRQMAAGGFGAVLMNGVKRGLFSNEPVPAPLHAPLPPQNVTARPKQALYRRSAFLLTQSSSAAAPQ